MIHKCGNCQSVFHDTHPCVGIDKIKHLTQRIDPGGVVPSGDCPECGALIYPMPRRYKGWKIQQRAAFGYGDLKSSTDDGPYITDCYATRDAARAEIDDLTSDPAPYSKGELIAVPYSTPQDIDLYD